MRKQWAWFLVLPLIQIFLLWHLSNLTSEYFSCILYSSVCLPYTFLVFISSRIKWTRNWIISLSIFKQISWAFILFPIHVLNIHGWLATKTDKFVKISYRFSFSKSLSEKPFSWKPTIKDIISFCVIHHALHLWAIMILYSVRICYQKIS